MSELKTFRVCVPFTEMVCGQEYYIVEAEDADAALDIVKAGDAYVDDMENEGAFEGTYRAHFDDADVEEW